MDSADRGLVWSRGLDSWWYRLGQPNLGGVAVRLTGVTPDDELVALCRREHPRLVGSLSLYTGDRLLAEELAQETLERLVASWPTVRQMPAPGAWAHRVGLNLAHSHFRRRAAEGRARRRSAACAGSEVVDLDTARALDVRRVVAALPRRQRAVVVLRFFADLSVYDVAQVLGIAEGTVKSVTAAAVAKLRTTLPLDQEERSDA